MSGYYCDDWRPNIVTTTGAKPDWPAFGVVCVILLVTGGALLFGAVAWSLR